MNETQFWQIIEDTKSKAFGEPDAQVDLVGLKLRELSPNHIQDFNQLFHDRLDEAYSWTLWAAAYLINGGCSDDGFEYFRCWLIGQGRKVFEAAVKEPDSLSAIVKKHSDPCENEGLLYVAIEALDEVAGQEMQWNRKRSLGEPKGENWDFDDVAETSRRLPQLFKMF